MENEEKAQEKINEEEKTTEPVKNQSENIAEMFKSSQRKEKIKKHLKRILIILAVLAIFVLPRLLKEPEITEEEFNYDIVKVEKGKISVTVEGDGVITANSIYNIVPKVAGEILQDYVEQGKYVKKDELLYVIDSKDVNNSINQANLGVQQSKVSVEQAQSNYNNIQNQINDLKIYASADGFVEKLAIDNGSYVNAMSQVCSISEKNTYEVILQFRTNNSTDIKVGNKVSLFYLDYFTYVEGIVSKISDSSSLSETGAQVTEVTIQVKTDGYNIQDARVEGTITLSNGEQVLSINQSNIAPVKSDVVVSDSAGVVKQLFIENGSYVHKGDLIAVLENSNLNTQLDNAKLSIDNANISKRNAENNLSTTRKQLDNYNITSPISGTIVFKNAKKGDVISSYQQSASNIMAVVADISVMKFEMQVDELDITKVKVGQEVTVTVEALDNKEFVGKVANINTIGINAAGSTNYTVIIEIPGNEEIYSGMTVDATVAVAEKDDVIRIPLTAVRKGDVVYRKNTDVEYQDEDTTVPKGYEKVKVELGLNSSEYVEILSGLAEGDEILVDKVTQSGTFSLENLGKMMREN